MIGVDDGKVQHGARKPLNWQSPKWVYVLAEDMNQMNQKNQTTLEALIVRLQEQV